MLLVRHHDAVRECACGLESKNGRFTDNLEG